jgi:hypothetical protein
MVNAKTPRYHAKVHIKRVGVRDQIMFNVVHKVVVVVVVNHLLIVHGIVPIRVVRNMLVPVKHNPIISVQNLYHVHWLPPVTSHWIHMVLNRYTHRIRMVAKKYDLLWTSSQSGGPLGVEDFLQAMKWTARGTNPSVVSDCTVMLVNGSEGPRSHIAVGVGNNLIDAHNMARFHVSGSYYTINQIYTPPAGAPRYSPSSWKNFTGDAGTDVPAYPREPSN